VPARLRKPGRVEQVVDRQQHAIILRRSGCTYEQIARQLKVSTQQAWRDCGAALKVAVERRDHDAARLLQLELERLDFVVLSMTPLARDGSTRAAAVLVRASESRRRLLGLDAATTLELSGRNGAPIATTVLDVTQLPDAEIERLFLNAATASRPGDDEPTRPAQLPLTPEEAYAARLAERGRAAH
jgi:hypothetical protein